MSRALDLEGTTGGKAATPAMIGSVSAMVLFVVDG